MTLIIFDIRSDKRRRRVVKLLESVGIRVQYSAFECVLTAAEEKRTADKLREIMNPEDCLRIYSFKDNTVITDIGCMPSVSELFVSDYCII